MDTVGLSARRKIMKAPSVGTKPVYLLNALFISLIGAVL